MAGDRLSPLSGPVVPPWLVAVDTAVARVVTVTDVNGGDANEDDDDGFTGELLLLLLEVFNGGDCDTDGPGLGVAIGVGVVVPGVALWWFSVCRRSDRASQYDLPHPSALHSYGFLFRCVSMWPLRWSCLLNAFEHIPQTYFRSSLCVSLCLARADAFPNTLLQT